jgi:hypothetical protein
MPVRRILSSSLSRDEIADGTGAVVRIVWRDSKRRNLKADLTDDEVAALMDHRSDDGQKIDWQEMRTRGVRRGRGRVTE